LDTLTGIDLIGQAKPLIKKPGGRSWTKTTLPFMAHGYEELVTPLHMLVLYNAIANNGRMMKPYLVNSIRELGVEVNGFKPQVLVDKICSDETLNKLKDCMLDVVESEHGTAKSLKTAMYSFGGKTGTAVSANDNHGYNKGNKIYQSAFIGFFPFDKPMYTIAVVIQNSNESKLAYGGVVSGPVFREVADKIYASSILHQPMYNPVVSSDSIAYKFYGLKRDLSSILLTMGMASTDSATVGDWRSLSILNNKGVMNTEPDSILKSMVPKARGLGLKDAVYLLENKGLKVVATGRGKVIFQSLPEGSGFNRGQTINITLN
jgi:cell division protein FtsI (penicillin-binding protein 3)